MNTTFFEYGEDALGRYLEAVTENEFGDVVATHKAYCPLLEHEWDGKRFFLQYDDQMNLVYDICNYLNFNIAESSDKTRSFKARTLRIYLCFMQLSGYDYTNLDNADIVESVCRFFAGDNFRDTEKKNVRSALTISNYISVIREFARYKRIKSTLLDQRVNFNIKPESDAFAFKPKIYRSSITSNPHASDIQKPFITPEEFMNLRTIAAQRKDTQAIILMHLMYFYGLRIGECLGLTEEDFVIRQKNYQPSPTILIRNRLSDKPFQFAKNLGHPRSKKNYNGKSYPHSKVKLTMTFYEKITRFMDVEKSDGEARGIRSKSLADTISKSYDQGDNHYVFLNKYGAPLSQVAWNKRLKNYFTAAGIPIDRDVRRDNLNHRFRHGCAIYYLRLAETKMSIEEVSSLLRDRIYSTYKYLTMTLDDEFILKQRFQDELLKEIPSL